MKNRLPTTTVPCIIVPGIWGSGGSHWQSIWQEEIPGAIRIGPSDWANPELADWLDALERAIGQCTSPPMLIAHSLGCLLISHWAAKNPRLPALASLLVAPVDPKNNIFPPAAVSFANPPDDHLPFPSLVLASENDPYCGIDAARAFAEKWGGGFISVGHLGHINAESSLGTWESGRNILTAFLAGLAVRI